MPSKVWKTIQGYWSSVCSETFFKINQPGSPLRHLAIVDLLCFFVLIKTNKKQGNLNLCIGYKLYIEYLTDYFNCIILYSIALEKCISYGAFSWIFSSYKPLFSCIHLELSECLRDIKLSIYLIKHDYLEKL